MTKHGAKVCSSAWKIRPRRTFVGLLSLFIEAAFVGDSQAQVLSGSYTGNATGNRAITGLGFQPDVVIVKGVGAQNAVIRSSTMVGDSTKDMIGATALNTNCLQSLDANGFTVGTDAKVNGNGVTYTWIAYKTNSAKLKVGTYTGDSQSSHAIAGVGFSPNLLIFISAAANNVVLRSSADGLTYQFDAVSGNSVVNSLDANGFTVGSDNRVNANGTTYHYVAWAEVSGECHVGSYSGNGTDNQNITGVGFQPEIAMIKSTSSYAGVQHTHSLGDATDISQYFGATANATNEIQALQSGGFQIGTGQEVNQAGVTYAYFAWKQVTGVVSPTILAITSVNGGSNPTAGTGFSVVVQSQNGAGTAANVVSNTAINLSLNAGSGILGSALTGTIPAGTNSITISGVTYTKAESGVILTATRTSGDTLTAGNSSSFTVNAGAVTAAQSTVSVSATSVAADNHTTSTITVTLNDTYGNPVSGKTVTLAKSGGSSTISAASGSSGANGVVTFTVSDAVAETAAYTATDSTDSITITQTASVTFNSLPWYNGGWKYRMAIQINHTNVSGTVTNFPMLINLTNSLLSQYAQTNGNDLLFTAGDGTNKLAHEIESYTSLNGLLVAWVKVPLLTSTADTNIYLYYGNAAAANQQNAGGVWDSNYKGVWHLSQTPAGVTNDIADSTTNNNSGTSQSMTAGAQFAGKIAGSLTFNGTNNYLSTSVAITNNPATLTEEAWVKTTSTNGAKVVGLEDNQTGTGSANYERHIYIGTDGKARFGNWNGSAYEVAVSSSAVNDGNWHELVGYRDNAAGQIGLYVDGVLQGTPTTSTGIGTVNPGWYRIGAYKLTSWPSGVSGYFKGSVDEVRVSHALRSAAWMATEYNNQSSPATFCSLGSQESLSATTLAITSLNGGSNPTAGTGFSVVVQSQNGAGTAANVVSNTAISLSLNTGNGILGGTLTGTIPAGTNSVTISGVTYTKAESGVVLTATRTSGDTLTAGNSGSFTINAGAVTAAQSAVSASPTSVAADNHTTSTITVILNDAYGNPVSGKTVTLAKSGGSSTISVASGSSGANGVVIFTVLDAIAESATYTATDSTDSITITQTASVTFNSMPWYNTGWRYRMAIQINHTNVSGTVTNFPLLINLTNSSLAQYAQTNGNDLLFTTGDGTNKLAHEIESYTNSTGTLVAWVKVPLLTSTADTNIYLYYGNAAAANQQNISGVWDTNYKGVWHLNQVPTGSAGDMVDSAAGNNGTSQTIAPGAQVAGEIGGSLTMDGTSDYITTATSFTNPQTLTLEAWVKTTGSGKKVVGFENTQTGTGSGNVDREIYFGTDGKVYFGTYSGSTDVAVSTNTLNNGQWHFLVGYRDNAASAIGLYVDGVLHATNSSTGAQSYTGWYRIGGYKSSGWPNLVADGYFPGSVDEIKISHSVRSAAWIATEYNNQKSPATFCGLGSSESQPPTKLVITSVNGGSNATYGTAFSVVVQAQDANGSAANVVTNTAVTLSLNNGAGALGGTLTGMIANGTSSLTVSGITYSKAQSGVILTATRTSGDSLTAGNSSPFIMNSAPLTVTANNTNRVYGAANPSFTASYSGFVNGETAGLVQGTPGFSTTATTSSPVNSYSITPSVGSLTAPNYSFTTFNNGTLTVTQASSTNVVTTSSNPSPTGSNVTFMATLTAVGPASGTPTGTVQFLADGAALGAAAPLSVGIANLTTNSLSHGTHVITAQYAGDGNFTGSTNTLSPNQSINSAPIAGSDTLQRCPTTGAKTRLTTLLANDSDPDGDTITLYSVSAASVQGGIIATNLGWVFYTRPAGYTNADSFSYVITDGSLQATGSVAVAIISDTNAAQNIELSQNLGNGSFLTSFFGIPGRTYTIQYATNLTVPNWQSLGTAAADATGQFQFTDSPGTNLPARFYRSTYP